MSMFLPVFALLMSHLCLVNFPFLVYFSPPVFSFQLVAVPPAALCFGQF